jgi:hypothetical protein
VLNRSGSEEQQALLLYAASQVNLKPEIFLRLGVFALGEFSDRFLEGRDRHPVPLRQESQVRIPAERSQMAEFAQ